MLSCHHEQIIFLSFLLTCVIKLVRASVLSRVRACGTDMCVCVNGLLGLQALIKAYPCKSGGCILPSPLLILTDT